jgi:hypothetical protein
MSALDDFFESRDRFVGLSTNEQIVLICWFVHVVEGCDRISPRDVIDKFKTLHLNPPRAHVYMPRLAEKKPPLLLWDKRGYFLEGRERKRLDDLLKPKDPTAAVSALLQSLTNAVQNGPERMFLDEAIRCYRVAAFRAAIVMAWNLAYDHLRRWVLSDTERLNAFNAGSVKRFQKAPKIVVKRADDFEAFKESEFIDALSSGKVITKNLEDMLREKLRRRNMAAHPSLIAIQQPQADDVISDLVKNVILGL